MRLAIEHRLPEQQAEIGALLARLQLDRHQRTQADAPDPAAAAGLLLQPVVAGLQIALPEVPACVAEIAFAVAGAQQVQHQAAQAERGELLGHLRDHAAAAVHLLVERQHAQHLTDGGALGLVVHGEQPAVRRVEEEGLAAHRRQTPLARRR